MKIGKGHVQVFLLIFIYFLLKGLHCWALGFSRYSSAWATRCGASCFGAQDLGCVGFSSCDAWTQWLRLSAPGTDSGVVVHGQA